MTEYFIKAGEHLILRTYSKEEAIQLAPRIKECQYPSSDMANVIVKKIRRSGGFRYENEVWPEKTHGKVLHGGALAREEVPEFTDEED